MAGKKKDVSKKQQVPVVAPISASDGITILDTKSNEPVGIVTSVAELQRTIERLTIEAAALRDMNRSLVAANARLADEINSITSWVYHTAERLGVKRNSQGLHALLGAITDVVRKMVS